MDVNFLFLHLQDVCVATSDRLVTHLPPYRQVLCVAFGLVSLDYT